MSISPTTSKIPTALAGGKRKREHAPPEIVDLQQAQEGTHEEQLHQLFKDAIELLKSHDVTPSILDHTIPPSSADSPIAKRPKLAALTGASSIARQVEANAYDSIDHISKDLEAVIASVVEEIEATSSNAGDGDKTKARSETHPDVVRAIAFKQEFNNIIFREILQRPYLLEHAGSNDLSSSTSDGIQPQSPFTADVGIDSDSKSYGTVLTIFGGIDRNHQPNQQPKQVFSSLRENGAHSINRTDEAKNTANKIGLPNGITFTKVVPVHSKGSREDTKAVPTLKELFAPPSTVQPLNPPRQSRHTITRSSSVNWYNPSEATITSRPNRRDSYSQQPMMTGQWLVYNIAPSTKDMSSPDSKRKQRDRALSFGEPQTELSEQTIALHRQAKEDALFRSVYSSFAPDRDNAGAIVSESNKDRMWWKRVGERRYNDTLSFSEEQYEDDDQLSEEDIDLGEDIQEVPLSEAVENWMPEETPAEFLEDTQQESDKAKVNHTDEILGEISQLLETLNSYQDVRNLTLPTNARTSAGQNPQLAAMTGTPTSPSSEELNIYNILKSQLSIMVSSLPPYALAKLDGKKLGVLGVNTKIQVETPNHQGSLEEDEISTKGRVPSTSATTGFPSRTSNAAVGIAPRNSYLGATSTPAGLSHRPNHMSQTVPARSAAAPSYLPNQQYSSRTPSANQYYSNTARPSYSAQRTVTSATPDRYPYSTSQQYGQQTARQSYTNAYGQYSSANGTGYGQGYGQLQQPSAKSRMSQSSYQQPARPPYTSTPTSTGAGTSVPKTAMQYTTQGYANQISGSIQSRPPLYQQHSSQNNSYSATSPQINGTKPSQGPSSSSEQVVNKTQPKVQSANALRASNNNSPQPVNAGQMAAGQPNGTSAG
ncbi:MAG: hypothetical protein Q9219_006797 [cf. Caloplaca sp. 3 TL-2023]